MHFLEERCSILLCALISDIWVSFPSVATSWLPSQGTSSAFGEETLLVMELLQFEGGTIFQLPWSSPPILLPTGTCLSVLHWMLFRLNYTEVNFPLFLRFFCVFVPLHMRHPLTVYVTNNNLLPNWLQNNLLYLKL